MNRKKGYISKQSFFIRPGYCCQPSWFAICQVSSPNQVYCVCPGREQASRILQLLNGKNRVSRRLRVKKVYPGGQLPLFSVQDLSKDVLLCSVLVENEFIK